MYLSFKDPEKNVTWIYSLLGYLEDKDSGLYL